jgi:hypothetical protein
VRVPARGPRSERALEGARTGAEDDLIWLEVLPEPHEADSAAGGLVPSRGHALGSATVRPSVVTPFLGQLLVVLVVVLGASVMRHHTDKSTCDIARRVERLGGPVTTEEHVGRTTLLGTYTFDADVATCTWRAHDQFVLVNVFRLEGPADAAVWVAHDRYRHADSPSLDLGDDSFAERIKPEIDTAVVASGSFVISIDAGGFGDSGSHIAQEVAEGFYRHLRFGWDPYGASVPPTARP